MKSSYFSKSLCVAALFCAGVSTFAVLRTAVAQESDVVAAQRCLDRADLSCAQRAFSRLDKSTLNSLEGRAIASRLAFYEGEYARAVSEIRAAVEETPEGDRLSRDKSYQQMLAHYETALAVTTDYESTEDPKHAVRFAPGADMILGEEGLEVLVACEREIAPLLGGSPDHKIVVELFPTADAFIDASDDRSPAFDDQGRVIEGTTRWRRAVQTTGVIGLSKWTRLLVTSPRAKPRGYDWKDTLAHEYIHLVVAARSADRVPVWLQEGLAKALESRWKGDSSVKISPHQETLLREALAADDLVTLEEMHPSMALLPTAERAALAFAQVALMVEYAISEGGEGAILKTIDAVRDGADAKLALAEGAGFSEFSAFYEGWLTYVRALELTSGNLSALPTVLDASGDDFAEDPLLAERKDLADFARLGDLLMDADRPLAALVEYTKATPPEEPISPLLAVRLARCHLALDAPAEATRILEESVRLYPEFALTHKLLGDLLSRDGANIRAIAAYRKAHDLNPYDAEIQSALVGLYEAAGKQKLADRHARYGLILAAAGRPLGASAAQN